MDLQRGEHGKHIIIFNVLNCWRLHSNTSIYHIYIHAYIYISNFDGDRMLVISQNSLATLRFLWNPHLAVVFESNIYVIQGLVNILIEPKYWGYNFQQILFHVQYRQNGTFTKPCHLLERSSWLHHQQFSHLWWWTPILLATKIHSSVLVVNASSFFWTTQLILLRKMHIFLGWNPSLVRFAIILRINVTQSPLPSLPAVTQLVIAREVETFCPSLENHGAGSAGTISMWSNKIDGDFIKLNQALRFWPKEKDILPITYRDWTKKINAEWGGFTKRGLEYAPGCNDQPDFLLLVVIFC